MSEQVVVFEEGKRGLICRSPEDSGSWIVPGKKESHRVTPVAGRVMRVKVTGETKDKKLRFCKVWEDVISSQEEELEKLNEVVAEATTYKELLDSSVAHRIPTKVRDMRCCLDEEGKPSIRSFNIRGPWLSSIGVEIIFREMGQVIRPPRPIWLGETEAAQQVLASGVVQMATSQKSSVPEGANEFLAEICRLKNAVDQWQQRTGEGWHSNDSDGDGGQSVTLWLLEQIQRLEAFDLRSLADQLEVPVCSVEVELQNLLSAQPSHVRLNDGSEREVKWSKSKGVVSVAPNEIDHIEVDPEDGRVSKIKEAGYTLTAETFWSMGADVDGYSAGKLSEPMGVGRDSRRLV